MENYSLFSGCSFTKGNGFQLNDQEPGLWVNLLHSSNKNLQSTKLINVGKGGRSNPGIFQDTVYYLTKLKPKYAFVEWTSMPRFEIALGLELYDTRCVLSPGQKFSNVNLNHISYTKSYLSNLRDSLLAATHLHKEIYNLVHFVNSLIRLADLIGTKLFFINGICPWDENYFNQLSNVAPSQYTQFTQELLSVSNRSDREIYALYSKMHNEYNDAGNIQPNYWINLYSSFKDLQIDSNSDGHHPGLKSNKIFSELINSYLQTTL
jgi:hypothetical protein